MLLLIIKKKSNAISTLPICLSIQIKAIISSCEKKCKLRINPI